MRHVAMVDAMMDAILICVQPSTYSSSPCANALGRSTQTPQVQMTVSMRSRCDQRPNVTAYTRPPLMSVAVTRLYKQ